MLLGMASTSLPDKAVIVPDSSQDVRRMEQAGRSETALVVERNVAALKIRPTTSADDRPESSIANTLRPVSPTDRRNSMPNLNRRTYVPTTPSPLNYTSSNTSNLEDTGDGQNEVASSPSSLNSKRASTGRGSLSRVAAGLRTRPANGLYVTEASQQEPHLESPRYLADLGRDYSRYPDSSTNLRPNSCSQTREPSPVGMRVGSSHTRSARNSQVVDSLVELNEHDYPDDRIGALDPYHGGEKGFILYENEIEDDDRFHAPDLDNALERLTFKEYFEPRTIMSTCGAVFLLLGFLTLFIVLPVLTFTTHIHLPSAFPPNPTTNAGGGDGLSGEYGPAWAHVNNNVYPLMSNVRKGLIDPDTPDFAKIRESIMDGSDLELVFSDEFNMDNRTFYPGDDPYWTAPDIWYGATQDMEWYDPDAVTTSGGTLQLRLDAFPNHNLPYRSGMLNSWNQLCFKGGVLEVSVSLAGPSGVPGLWPGVWSMGNLGRPGYKATTEGVWPYTYNSCDAGITPNQSSPDGLSYLPGQKLSSCTCAGEDHPSPGTGRGAPEIDVLEASVDPTNLIGVVTQSFQVAPFDVLYRPNSEFMQIPNYETTMMNGYCGGPFQQAVSATTLLNHEWYNNTAYQKYAFEYAPGDLGFISWFVGEHQTFMMDARAIGSNGNVAQRQISEEPMSIVLNLGISGSWSEILFDKLLFPTVMHIDYVRIYQKPGENMTTCDPPGYPTTQYIQNHLDAYSNPNLTVWNETGYGWPKNKLTGC